MFAKRKLPITFELVYGETPLRIGDNKYTTHSGREIQIQTLRFYISGIELYDGTKLLWKETNSFHLIDASKPNTLQIQFEVPELLHYTTIKFKLGIDSITNVSGAIGGDLDPSKGMYWAWQSGYVNFKLEGISPTCKTRNNEFQFHIGGYAAPYASIQEVTLQTTSPERITILTDISKFINPIDLATLNSIMIPCADAVTLSRQAATIFSIKK